MSFIKIILKKWKKHEIGTFYSFTILLFLICSCSFSKNTEQYRRCIDDTNKQSARANELKTLVEADQNERANWKNLPQAEKLKLIERDRVRRKQVGEIFGEGCFKTADDFAAAA